MSTHRIPRTEILHLLEVARNEGRPREVLERLQWFLAFSENNSISTVCDRFGISRSTFYRWARRFDRSNLGTLEDRESSFPETLGQTEQYTEVYKTTTWNWKGWSALVAVSLFLHLSLYFAIGSRLLAANAHVTTLSTGRSVELKDCQPRKNGNDWNCSVTMPQ